MIGGADRRYSEWKNDPWGTTSSTHRHRRADYAFFQHILKSMDPKKGRSAVLFPHGVLFRKDEADLRRKLVATDMVECVLGLGPSLFYNSADIGAFSPSGYSFALTFDRPGTYQYQCPFHGDMGMKGTITVVQG